MWKPWKFNNNYEIPEKPTNRDDQISMMWDFLYNHLPGRLHHQDRKINFQDHKLNFVLILLAILLACWAKSLF